MTSPTSAYNVTPDDYASHLRLAEEHDLNLWENHGWGIRSIEEDGDALVWTSPYLLRSRRNGPFIKEKFCALQSMIAHVRYTRAQKRRMHDNDFIALGWNGLNDLRVVDELKTLTDGEKAVWQVGGMCFEAAPPIWKVQGVHRDIHYDIACEAESPAIWLTDRNRSALEHGDRWYLVNARSRGTVKVADIEIPMAGMGWHERHVHLNDYYDPIELLQGPGILFHNGYSSNLHVHLMARPRLGIFRARILHEGVEYDFSGKPSVSVDVLEEWLDPRSRMVVPSSWLVTLTSGNAELELHVQAFARTYYLWNFLTGGVNLLYWWIAEANGHFDHPSGRRIDIVEMKHVVHQNQVMYRYT